MLRSEMSQSICKERKFAGVELRLNKMQVEYTMFRLRYQLLDLREVLKESAWAYAHIR